MLNNFYNPKNGKQAIDREGNIALGYSIMDAASGTRAGIAYAGRRREDPLGTLPQGEVVMQAGGGVQTTDYQRWGDYSTMTLDPTDESGYDPADEGSLEVSEADGKGVIITWDAGTEPDVDNAFVRVDLGKTPDMQYPDMVHTQCRVTVPTRTPDEVAGSFTCKDLPNFDDPDKTLAAAKGTFSAHR